MEKAEFQEKALRNKEAARVRQKAYFTEQARKIEAKRSNALGSLYRPFEVEFGAGVLKEINDFLFSLDKSELANHYYIYEPLLKICQKLFDWKAEVGRDRLWHEFLIHYRNEGSTYVIKKAWEEVNKEQDIIEVARMAYSKRINKMRDATPKKYSEDAAAWIALCEGFSEFEALQEFGYPLPFDSVFGEYQAQSFNYGKPQDNGRFFGNQ